MCQRQEDDQKKGFGGARVYTGKRMRRRHIISEGDN